MSTISINNNSYHGRNISVINNKVYIDGKDVTPDSKEINISVVGNVGELKVDNCNKITITGDVESIETQSGDVKCGSVSKSVKTMSGDVECGNVGGDIKTMSGDINYKK
jgi:hypothetical protein